MTTSPAGFRAVRGTSSAIFGQFSGLKMSPRLMRSFRTFLKRAAIRPVESARSRKRLKLHILHDTLKRLQNFTSETPAPNVFARFHIYSDIDH